MTARHLVDLELIEALDNFPKYHFTTESLPHIRTSFKALTTPQPSKVPSEFSMISVHLEGLPPTFIGVGSIDLVLEEDLEYARRLMRAGVLTELHVYPGAYHAFDIAKDAMVTQSFVRNQLEALKRVFLLKRPIGPSPILVLPGAR